MYIYVHLCVPAPHLVVYIFLCMHVHMYVCVCVCLHVPCMSMLVYACVLVYALHFMRVYVACMYAPYMYMRVALVHACVRKWHACGVHVL